MSREPNPENLPEVPAVTPDGYDWTCAYCKERRVRGSAPPWAGGSNACCSHWECRGEESSLSPLFDTQAALWGQQWAVVAAWAAERQVNRSRLLFSQFGRLLERQAALEKDIEATKAQFLSLGGES